MKGIRTIALRLTGTKEAAEELEEMGEDTSDMIMSQSKMRDLIMNATKVASNDYKGFDIQDELGRYKSTYEIMLGLSQIWDEIQQADFKTGDNRQNLLLESIAGKNRASIAASILQNPETLQSVYEDSSTKAAGSAMEENQKYLDSISGHLAKLKNAWQEMWASAANREVINGVIDLATALLKAVDSVGLLGTAFGIFYGGAIIKGLMSANSWLVKFIASLDRLRESSTSVGELLSNIFGGNKTDADNGGGFFKGLAQINKNRERPASETPKESSAPETSKDTSTDQKSDVTETADTTKKLANAEASKKAAEEAEKEAKVKRELAEANKESEAASQANVATQEAENTAVEQGVTADEAKAQSEKEKAKADLEEKNANEQQIATQQLENEAVGIGAGDKKLTRKKKKKMISDFNNPNMSEDDFYGKWGDYDLPPQYRRPEVPTPEVPEGIDNGAVIEGLNAETAAQEALNQAKAEGATIQAEYNSTKQQEGESSAENIVEETTEKQAEELAQNKKKLEVKPFLDGEKEKQEAIRQSAFEQAEADAQSVAGSTADAAASEVETSAELAAANAHKKSAEESTKDAMATGAAASASEKDALTSGMEGAAEGVGAGAGAGATGLVAGLTNPMTWLALLPIALMGISAIYSKIKKDNQELIDQGKEASNTWNESGKSLTEYEQRLTDLNTQLQNPNLSGQEELEIRKQIFDVQKQIKEEYGKAAEGVDLTNSSLNQQLDTLRKIRKEQAKENYKDSGGSYDEAIKKMEGTVGGGILNNGYHLQLELDYGHEDQFKKIMEEAEKAGFSVRKSEDGTLALFDIKTNAEDAETALDSLSQSLLDVQTEMGKGWEGSYFEDFSKSVFKTIKQNDNFLTKYRDTYYAALETKLFNENDEGADLYFRYGEGVENYNTALLSGDKEKIEEAKQAWESLTQEKERYVNSKIASGGQDYSRLFGSYEKDLNQEAISAYNIQEKMGTEESKTLVEKAFGTYKENKRVSKENQKAVIEASKAVLKEWSKANKEGKKIDLGSEAVQNLAKVAHEAEIPFSTITRYLQDGNINGFQQVLDGTRISAEDLENAFYQTGSAINQLGGSFGITFDSPQADIDAFISKLSEMVGVTSESTLQSGDALSHFFSETSAKIDKVNALSSIVQHGLSQTGLTFTKTLDDQGHEVASEVKTIIDAYKDLEGFDIGSLFEETSTGIQLNMDAYRALAAEEEAETERMYKLNRARLQNQLETAPTDERKDAIQRQIQELDLLQTAYEGATSAFAKYISQQNAGDYQDNYETIRDNAVKRGNELLQKGYVGTEEFRSIAQLFSNESLANADVDTVMKAYQDGLANVQKYLTEDARVGMQTFLDDLMNMPYEFGTYFNSDMLAQMSEEEKQMIMDQTGLTEEALGKIDGYYLQFTDAQEQQLADHLGVSTDMLESFFNMLNALGFDIHFYKDGTDTDFTKLNEDIENSRKNLLDLKEVANDPNLVSKLDFSVEELDTADELKQKITDLEQLKTELPVDTDAYEEANRLIDELREKLGLIEAHEVTPNIKLEDYSKVEETMENIQGAFDKAKEVDFNFDEGSSAELEQAANLLSTLPEEVVTNYGFEYTDGDPKAMYDQLVELYNLGNGDLELGLKVKKEGLDEAKQEADDLNNTDATMNVDAELTGDKPLILQWLEGLSALFTVNAEASEVEKVKQEAEKPVQIPAHLVAENSEEDVVSQDETAGTTITYMVNVDTSEAESSLETIQQSAEQPIEIPLTLKAQNTVQDAVNQAGGNQPAVVNQQTTTTETVNHVENYTANTSGLEEARNALTSLQSKSGSTVSVNVGVSGAEKITQTQTKLNQLLQKAKSKINVVVNGNHSGFLKSYNETISKLNEIAKKDTTAKIKGDNSNLKDKVSEAKSK